MEKIFQRKKYITFAKSLEKTMKMCFNVLKIRHRRKIKKVKK